jgi:hypothetical protein
MARQLTGSIFVLTYVILNGLSLIVAPASALQPLGALSLASALAAICLLNYVDPIREFVASHKERLAHFVLFGAGLAGVILVLIALATEVNPAVSAAGSLGLYEIGKWIWKRAERLAIKIFPKKQIKTIDASLVLNRSSNLAANPTQEEVIQYLELARTQAYHRTESFSGMLFAKFPFRLHEDDSTTVEVIFGAESRQKENIILCKLVMPIPGELRVQLQAAAFEIAGEIRQSIRLVSSNYGRSESFVWNLSPKKSGKLQIGLIIEIQNSYSIKETFRLPIRVIKLFGLTARQIRLITVLFSIITGLLALAHATRQLGLW